MLLHPGDFVGEELLVAGTGIRTAIATAITGCTAARIEKAELFRVVHDEHTFSDLFLSFLLARGRRPGGSDRPAFQLQRKAPGTHSAVNGGCQ